MSTKQCPRWISVIRKHLLCAILFPAECSLNSVLHTRIHVSSVHVCGAYMHTGTHIQVESKHVYPMPCNLSLPLLPCPQSWARAEAGSGLLCELKSQGGEVSWGMRRPHGMAAKPSSSAVLQQTARLQHARQLQCLRGCRFPGNHFAFSMYPG